MSEPVRLWRNESGHYYTESDTFVLHARLVEYAALPRAAYDAMVSRAERAERERDEARAKALEDAARVAEAASAPSRDNPLIRGANLGFKYGVQRAACAMAIRALLAPAPAAAPTPPAACPTCGKRLYDNGTCECGHPAAPGGGA